MYFIAFGVLFTWYPWILGLTTIWGILTFDLLFLATFVVFVVVAFVIVRALEKRPNFGKAELDELRREDDILLQATAFSQAALWIYLNLLPNTEYITLFKWVIPSTAILFYSVRAYAKMKDNNKWRYGSMFILTLIIGISLYFVIRTSLQTQFTGFVRIDNVDVTFPLLGVNFSLILF